jgi:hypothetical protein
MSVEPTTSDDDDALVNSVECSRVGVSVVDLVSLVPGFDFPADQRFKPCWSQALENPHRTLGGPTLPPGEYELVVRGLRSSGEPWTYCFVEDGAEVCGDPFVFPRCEESDDGPRCERGYGVCDCRFIDVVDGETIEIPDLVLDAPPECEDGIDGDGDGLVDERDPGCEAANREDVDVISTQLVLDFSLLSGNAAATCVGVEVSRFEITFDDSVVSTPPCRVGEVGVLLNLSEGSHEVSVRALAFDGTAVTRVKRYTVEATPAGVLDPRVIEVDFADTDFLEPIQSRAIFGVGYIPGEGVPLRSCDRATAGGGGAPGLLQIDDVSIRLLDAVGDPVEPAPVVANGDLQGMRLDGSPAPCTSAAIITESLRWGVYQVEVEARSPEGDVCFSNVGDAALLAPGVQVDVQLPRVLPISDSCRDCANDADCGGAECRDGVCFP